MNSTMQDIVNIVKQGVNNLEGVQQEINKLHRDAANYAPKFYNDSLIGLEQKRQEVRAQTLHTVSEILKNRQIPNDVVNFENVNPAFLAVVNAGLPVSPEELRAAFLKAVNSGDRSTALMVERYAKQNKQDLEFGLHLYTESEHRAANDVVMSYASSALSRPEYANTWFDAEYLENAVPGPMKGAYTEIR